MGAALATGRFRSGSKEEKAMFRLLTTTCPTCQNRFHVEADDGEPPAPVASGAKCPRCNGPVHIPADAGEP